MDYYHKALLGAVNVKRIAEIPHMEISIDKLAAKFSEIITEKNSSMDPQKLLEKLIKEHHFQSFMKRPFITLESTKVKIGYHK